MVVARSSKIVPIADRHQAEAEKSRLLLHNSFRARRSRQSCRKSWQKISEARSEEVPYIIVIGDKELHEHNICIRDRKGDRESVSVEEFLAELRQKILRRDY